jgi:hypothetical protein
MEVIETLSIACPLGVQFWDVAEGRAADAGLRVFCYPEGAPAITREATRTRSGTYAFHRLPFLREAENGAGDEAFWRDEAPQRAVRFVVEAQDVQNRFLPIRFTAVAPHRGPFGWRLDVVESPASPISASPSWALMKIDGPGSRLQGTSESSPAGSVIRVPLFSAPWRSPIGGLAIINGEVRDASGQAAAWAVVTICFETPRRDPIYGIALADINGRFQLTFPYPEPAILMPGSPAAPASLRDQVWEGSIEVFWENRTLLSSPASPLADEQDQEELTDLNVILSQPAALMAPNGTAQARTQISFGRASVVSLKLQQ